MVKPYCDNNNKVLSFTPLKKSELFSQAIMANRFQWRKGGANISHNRTEKIIWCKFNSNALASCILIGSHTSLEISRVSSVNYPNIMVCHRNNIFLYGEGVRLL